MDGRCILAVGYVLLLNVFKTTTNSDIVVETCAICRNHLMEPCIECQPNTLVNGNDDCIAAWGVCNHAFHLHCIQRWLKSRHVCPLDNREWTYQKFGN